MVDIKFSAQVSNARNKWLTLTSTETLEAGLNILREKYSLEKNDNRRLGNLAAQTWIIRKRLERLEIEDVVTIGELMENSPEKKVKSVHYDKLESQSQTASEDTSDAGNDVSINSKLQVINISEEVMINDMRFFAGSRVEVSLEDATRLIEAGKASLNEQ
jgi:hypothetical protein